MSIYDGMVRLNDQQVPVIIGFQENSLRMSSGGEEIGEWAEGDYSIDHAGEGLYTITAENEQLQFAPSNPTLFAAGLGEGVEPLVSDESPAQAKPTGTEVTNDEAPLPKKATMMGFYALAAVTAGLGLWALVSLIF